MHAHTRKELSKGLKVSVRLEPPAFGDGVPRLTDKKRRPFFLCGRRCGTVERRCIRHRAAEHRTADIGRRANGGAAGGRRREGGREGESREGGKERAAARRLRTAGHRKAGQTNGGSGRWQQEEECSGGGGWQGEVMVGEHEDSAWDHEGVENGWFIHVKL